MAMHNRIHSRLSKESKHRYLQRTCLTNDLDDHSSMIEPKEKELPKNIPPTFPPCQTRIRTNAPNPPPPPLHPSHRPRSPAAAPAPLTSLKHPQASSNAPRNPIIHLSVSRLRSSLPCCLSLSLSLSSPSHSPKDASRSLRSCRRARMLLVYR